MMKWPFEDSRDATQETAAWEFGLLPGRHRFSCGQNPCALVDFFPPRSAKEGSAIEMGLVPHLIGQKDNVLTRGKMMEIYK